MSDAAAELTLFCLSLRYPLFAWAMGDLDRYYRNRSVPVWKSL